MFKDKLKQLRTEHNLTQSDIARAIGVSPATIGNYEQGTREPRNNEIWQKLADYFNISVDELMDKSSLVEKFGDNYDLIIQENIILKQENDMLKKKLQSIIRIANM